MTPDTRGNILFGICILLFVILTATLAYGFGYILGGGLAWMGWIENPSSFALFYMGFLGFVLGIRAALILPSSKDAPRA